jgi:hypothetical protein
MLHTLGEAESESGNFASAAEALRSALAVDPSAVELGIAYRLKGDLERAALTLQQVCAPSLSFFFLKSLMTRVVFFFF